MKFASDVGKTRSNQIFVRKSLVNLLLLCVVILVCFLLFEVVVRLVGLAPTYGLPPGMMKLDEQTGYGLMPNFSSQIVTPEFQHEIEINSKGLRESEIDYQSSKSRYRILALGDSFLFGTGVTEEHVYVNLLERQLQQSYDVDVINAGVGGYGPWREYAYLMSEGYKWEPDMILVSYFIGNDLQDDWSYPGDYYIVGGYLVETVPTIKTKTRWFIYNHCKACLFTARAVTNIKLKIQAASPNKYPSTGLRLKQFLDTPDNLTLDAYNRTAQALVSIESFAAQHNITLVIMLVPTKLQTRELQQRYLRSEDGYNYQKPNEMIRSFMDDHTVVDFLEEGINSSDYYYATDIHWNLQGHVLAAEVLLREFEKDELIPENFKK